MYRGSYGSTASHIWILMLKPQSNAPIIDLFSLYVLFSQYSSCENTQENRFSKFEGQVPMGPLLGKQNIQAKEAYFSAIIQLIKAS